MSQASLSPEERFATIVAEFVGIPSVTPPLAGKRFGSAGLKIHNHIFAMLVGDCLVVKLPKPRVDALVASGAGARFDPRRDGRVMKEWVSVESTSDEDWLSLAREAMAFVAPKH